jgi:protein disulfide-isomerase
MKRIAIGLLAALAVAQAVAGELEWLTDLSQAQAKAKTEKKMVLLDFTGSDWCVWCVRLKEEIFSKPEFSDYARKNLLLVEVDFPRKKPMSEQQKKANRALADKYGIKGYPTLIILDSDGKKAGELGYMRGGPKPFIAELEKLKSR